MRNCCVAFQRSRVGAGMNRFAKGVKCNARLSGPKNWMRYIKTRLYLFYSHRIDFLLNVKLLTFIDGYLICIMLK